jgi:hypothetical protein
MFYPFFLFNLAKDALWVSSCCIMDGMANATLMQKEDSLFLANPSLIFL